MDSISKADEKSNNPAGKKAQKRSVSDGKRKETATLSKKPDFTLKEKPESDLSNIWNDSMILKNHCMRFILALLLRGKSYCRVICWLSEPEYRDFIWKRKDDPNFGSFVVKNFGRLQELWHCWRSHFKININTDIMTCLEGLRVVKETINLEGILMTNRIWFGKCEKWRFSNTCDLLRVLTDINVTNKLAMMSTEIEVETIPPPPLPPTSLVRNDYVGYDTGRTKKGLLSQKCDSICKRVALENGMKDGNSSDDGSSTIVVSDTTDADDDN